jgi:hypothetical protein
MKKKSKKKSKSQLTPFGHVRAQVVEEPLSAGDHPDNLRLELERALDCARRTLKHFGGQTPVVILYSSEKKVMVEFEIKDDKTKLIAKAAVKSLANQVRATAAVFVCEAWVRPPGSIFKEDPRREEAIVATGKNRDGHLTALQKFYRLSNGQFLFEAPLMSQPDRNSSAYDTWLDGLEF